MTTAEDTAVFEHPTHEELWGIDRLKEHAAQLARHAASSGRTSRADLIERLRDDERCLERAYHSVVSALHAGRAITPAAEWLVDNFHVVGEHFTAIRSELATRLWRDLPALQANGAAARPRIVHIVGEYLAHSDFEFNADSFVEYLTSFQSIAPLTMRELWLLSPAMRFALVDELRRLSVRIEAALSARSDADLLANGLLGDGTHQPHPSEVARLRLPAQPYRDPFVVQLAHRLQSMGDERQAVLEQLTSQLALMGTTVDAVVQREHTRRSGSNLSVRNVITSLRAIALVDWRALFERTSQVELLLHEVPSYHSCDRRTRHRYRQCIQDLAQELRLSEIQVAHKVLQQLTMTAARTNDATTDIGELLIGPRRPELETALGYRAPLTQRMLRWVVHRARALYCGGVLLLTTVIIALTLLLASGASTLPLVGWCLLGVLALFPASELAIGFVNRLWMQGFRPRHLPRRALEHGLPADCRTLVVMPVMLRRARDAAVLIEQLEVHALANPDPNVRYALLSDWADSESELAAGDSAILDAARDGIQALNLRDRQPPPDEPRFYLFHRRRLWNEREQCFMGWERKRGKLVELNQLLLGGRSTSFISPTDGPPPAPRQIRYVLTLDADTRLPLGTVRDLVGVASHPLNTPVFDPAKRRIVRGYGILQPRVTALLPTPDERSLYRDIVTGGSGLDPYTAAASDIYQDVFGEGLFSGKGLYDVAAFQAAMSGRVPDNSILSHDLFEGLFARCALITDVELFEDFPSHSEVAAARAHRWIRGDWQLLPWILGLHGPLPAMGRWKMCDNLRRALMAPAAVAFLVAGWCLAPASAAAWLLLVLLPWVWPATASVLLRLTTRSETQSILNHARQLTIEFAEDIARAAVMLGMLAQNAWLSIDAIGRALFRTAITHRRRLEWVTAAQLKQSSSHALPHFIWSLKGASIVVLIATALLMWRNPGALPIAAPLLLLWWLSPLLARSLSRPLEERRPDTVTGAPEHELQKVARATWRFFEQFVTADDHWLPPDNFQELPVPEVAHRSSPTNFGLYLLTVVAARDFGWLGLQQLVRRLAATMDSLDKLERCNGHFLNWYDTQTLAPLEPKYVSTVDSGNLAGHLLTLARAALQMPDSAVLAINAFKGPVAAIGMLTAELAAVDAAAPAAATAAGELRVATDRLRLSLNQPPSDLPAAARALRLAHDQALRLEDMAQALVDEGGQRYANIAAWARLLIRDIATHLVDLDALLPGTSVDHANSHGSAWTHVAARMPCDTSLRAIVEHHTLSLEKLRTLPAGSAAADEVTVPNLIVDLERAVTHGRMLIRQLEQLAERSRQMAQSMRFGFLFERSRGLFSIGYRVADQTLDSSYYDLLASEARLASMVAIATGDVPRSHWFKLGRRLTGGSRHPVLASWSGSMFEYLMPALVMHEPAGSLLDQSSRNAVILQVAAGATLSLPWGISESAFNVRDRKLTYQYSAFGLSSLGLKRGLAADQVVAPYATALAAIYDPAESERNFQALSALGARGQFGFYEAVDFTARRVPDGSKAAVVSAYMAHHQGMSLVALDNALNDRIMQQRFHAEPLIRAAELLLQERAVRFCDAPVMIEAEDIAVTPRGDEPEIDRRSTGLASREPVTHLLSNRRYSVMLTDAGAGYSLWRSLAVTRWRADATQCTSGIFIYLRDVATGSYWSAGLQPSMSAPDEYEVVCQEELVTITRRDGSLTTSVEVVVAPEDDGELRHVTLRNNGSRTRTIEVTSYAEVVLAAQGADVAHPGFSNLFVCTEYAAEVGALLATRRQRSSEESPVWATHVLSTSPRSNAHLEYETDRMRFVGRGRSLAMPQVVHNGNPLSNTVGSVLDPIFSLRTRVEIAPQQATTITFATLVAGSREAALGLAAKYRHPGVFEHARDLAWTFVRAELHHLQSDLAEARLFQILAGGLLFQSRQLRASADIIAANQLDVTHLWRFAISGDHPILLIRCRSVEDQGFIRQCLRAQEYLRIKRLIVDVVILNELQHSYIQDLQTSIERTIRMHAAMISTVEGDERGSVFALRADGLGKDEHTLLLARARVVLQPAQGSLAEQLLRQAAEAKPLSRPSWLMSGHGGSAAVAAPDSALPAREFFNGLGGFAAQGREYAITLAAGKNTPAPWSNIIANDQLGSLITESGSMCTWSLNSRENQLTPWSDDPVSDPTGEAYYIQDADSALLWSATPLPIRLREARYEIHHGQGYSRFNTTVNDIDSELLVLVAPDDPVKLCRLRLSNRSTRARRLTVAVYVEWSLGASRAASAPDIVTEVDTVTGAMLARNAALADFGSRVAFADLGGRQQYWTASRREFLGRDGSTAAPAGMHNVRKLSHRTGAALDPCCVFALTVEIAAGEIDQLVFSLGQAADAAQARALIQRHRDINVDTVMQRVEQQWEQLLGTVQIRTPDRALDLLFNRWLLYQVISCRLWGRAGFYQAGGAYGFRDQLQDGMALSLASPAHTRAHLLRAASRQFPEGDVQHWWHPPSGRGVRTHCSDDRVWLPFATSQYLEVTKDWAVLDEETPFIEGMKPAADREDAHYVPATSAQYASLYEHCARALDVSLPVGAHGLPLMGGGDWNDGMNRVGQHGRGESVWLAWFLITALRQFAPIADRRGESQRAAQWRQCAVDLSQACESHGWDGAWYRRAYFDDGSPLGSAANVECRIDSLTQSWAVLSAAADPGRAAMAMDAVEQNLVRGGDGLVLLFTPPFDVSSPDPGYVKGYLPGLRENGGQYTHAAIWVLMAQAALGDGAQVGTLLDMLNPIRRADSRSGMQAYRVEPYVMAADIYSNAQHARRGGWTWYTGAAGWFYRAILESVLGIVIRGDLMTIAPCIPPHWNDFEVNIKTVDIDYRVVAVRVQRTQNPGIDLDGVPVDARELPLYRDGRRHEVRLAFE